MAQRAVNVLREAGDSEEINYTQVSITPRG